MEKNELIPATSSIITAYFLYFVTFYVRPLNFWLDISVSTFIFFILAVIFSKPFPITWPARWKNLVIGFLSAILLYFIFLIGGEMSKFLPFGTSGINSIYYLAMYQNKIVLTLLLIFPISIGEESLWRGFIQYKLARRYGGWVGYIVAVLGDSTTHISSLNPILVIAAFVSALVWAYLFKATNDLSTSITSHIVWDIFIFVLFPIRV
ncbi:MAG: type II CAAX endopeptidase family protein [Conexivisphaerales archaeon]